MAFNFRLWGMLGIFGILSIVLKQFSKRFKTAKIPKSLRSNAVDRRKCFQNNFPENADSALGD